MSRTRAYKAISEEDPKGSDVAVIIPEETIRAISMRWKNKKTGEIRNFWTPDMGPEWEEVSA